MSGRTYAEFFVVLICHLAHLPDAYVCISGATGVALPQSESCWLTQLVRDAILCEAPIERDIGNE